MSNNNINLGQYDMVLALSENKINFEIRNLLKRGIIRPEWQFLTDSLGKDSINNSNQKFEEAKKAWLGKNSLEKKLKILKDTLQEKQDQLDDAEGEKRLELRKERDIIKEALIALKNQIDSSSKYNILVDAILDAPQIALIKDSHTELLFKLIIKKGTFYYIDDQEVKECDLKDKLYAFKVPVNKLRIKSNGMYLADGETMKQLRDEGFNDNDFTVDAIFLDFERADIGQYSMQESILPDDTNHRPYLQVAIINYFKGLGSNKDNPYILGYTINKKKLAARDKAMLYPTGASFSTSLSKIERASAFNFLLLTENHQFPEIPKGGRIDNSLIEEVLDKSVTASGVIAIDFETFKNTYLNEIKAAVANAFLKSFNRLGNVKLLDGVPPNEDHFIYTGNGVRMNFTLRQTGITNDNNKNYIAINYTIAIAAIVHEEISAAIGTVGVDQKFSTSGRYEINGKKGAEGALVIRLSASEKGKIEIEKPSYTPPLVGRNTEDPEYKHDLDRIWLKISDLFKSISGVEKMYIDNFLNNIVDTLKDIDFDALEDFSNKVVLPGSNVYTFKNIRLLNAKQDQSDAVLFDIAYVLAAD
ncbi:hypothetical protein [Pedobacter nyackensis]|uniref:hypothetical protein n=1 Tax=Pedobacter nyackensis TaxID=475255 RepID=UPI0029309D95|nr:hypothetical protein [Pedobacter nyackensis]